ncbi:hypothetical protein JCM19236_823 [Vibrio sp. JCM 19236]|nr:hypothetical protein JCM19236_823 [Vibrio sp. JCM 19236]
MLSYRHSFHAGNHADVVKHIVQSLILDALKQKDKPFVYHDTHSGVGRYDLTMNGLKKPVNTSKASLRSGNKTCQKS